MSDGRIVQMLRAIVREFLADTKYHGLYEYRAVGSSSTALDLLPARAQTGLPPLSAVPMRTGLGGATSTVLEGTSVLVAFVDGDPTRPVVVSYGDPNDPAFEQYDTLLAQTSSTDPADMASPTGRVVRYGDSVSIAVSGAVATGPVLPHAVPTPVSRVKG